MTHAHGLLLALPAATAAAKEQPPARRPNLQDLENQRLTVAAAIDGARAALLQEADEKEVRRARWPAHSRQCRLHAAACSAAGCGAPHGGTRHCRSGRALRHLRFSTDLQCWRSRSMQAAAEEALEEAQAELRQLVQSARQLATEAAAAPAGGALEDEHGTAADRLRQSAVRAEERGVRAARRVQHARTLRLAALGGDAAPDTTTLWREDAGAVAQELREASRAVLVALVGLGGQDRPPSPLVEDLMTQRRMERQMAMMTMRMGWGCRRRCTKTHLTRRRSGRNEQTAVPNHRRGPAWLPASPLHGLYYGAPHLYHILSVPPNTSEGGFLRRPPHPFD